MVKWKLCLGTGLLAACCFSAGAFAAGHVEDVEAISQVYGDGEKLAEVQRQQVQVCMEKRRHQASGQNDGGDSGIFPGNGDIFRNLHPSWK